MSVTSIDEAAAAKFTEEAKRLKIFRAPLAEYFREAAVIRKIAFDAHVDAGFTESQALEIVRDIEGE